MFLIYQISNTSNKHRHVPNLNPILIRLARFPSYFIKFDIFRLGVIIYTIIICDYIYKLYIQNVVCIFGIKNISMPAINKDI